MITRVSDRPPFHSAVFRELPVGRLHLPAASHNCGKCLLVKIRRVSMFDRVRTDLQGNRKIMLTGQWKLNRPVVAIVEEEAA